MVKAGTFAALIRNLEAYFPIIQGSLKSRQQKSELWMLGFIVHSLHKPAFSCKNECVLVLYVYFDEGGR